MSEQPTDAVLVIADISGYTRFMLANRTAVAHGQGIVSDLLSTVVAQAEVPLNVEKFEGDAVFLAAERDGGGDDAWRTTLAIVGRRLPALVAAFDDRLRRLAGANACPCTACTEMHRLRLKVVAHVGRALRYRIGRFAELAGPDVIAVHRLLKNRIPADSYLLLSEDAHRGLAPAGTWSHGHEDLADIGRWPVRWLALEPAATGTVRRPLSLTDSFRKMGYSLRGLLRPRADRA